MAPGRCLKCYATTGDLLFHQEHQCPWRTKRGAATVDGQVMQLRHWAVYFRERARAFDEEQIRARARDPRTAKFRKMAELNRDASTAAANALEFQARTMIERREQWRNDDTKS